MIPTKPPESENSHADGQNQIKYNSCRQTLFRERRMQYLSEAILSVQAIYWWKRDVELHEW
jgi:hypothetical protein